MAREDEVERALHDPAYRAAYRAAYRGPGDAAEALQRIAAPTSEDLQPDAARVLYGPDTEDDQRRQVAARVALAAAERAAVLAALDRARADVPPPEVRSVPEAQPAGETASSADPADPRGAARWRPAVLAVAAGLAALLALVGGYSLGSARPALRPAAARPTPTSLPTVLYLDDRDGEVIHLAYSKPGDSRSITATLPEMLAGWSMATACLSRNSRPRTVPTENVVLLDGAGRQLGSWTVPCDTAERRYFAIPAPAKPGMVQLLLLFDERTVRAGWATIDPNR